MSSRTDAAAAYFDAFAANDHAKILSLLTDDVVWTIHGHRDLQGKEAFDSEIENDAFQGAPQLDVDRLIEAGETVVVPHVGEVRQADGALFRFAACDILTFTGEDLISRVESYVVPLLLPTG
ncbi:nuclear transport factor 2 family protein [Pseudonocardia tropica]|uniref:Nuclear transport factor 2 family protein n=1 Tax=Pseudonocardia tropica TaxID=681289 RepID=A0ABV1K478_9PSEU